MDRELDLVCVTASRPQMTNILYRYRPAHDPFIPMLLVGFDDTEMKAYFDVLKQGNVCLDNIPLGQEPDQIQQQELWFLYAIHNLAESAHKFIKLF